MDNCRWAVIVMCLIVMVISLAVYGLTIEKQIYDLNERVDALQQLINKEE